MHFTKGRISMNQIILGVKLCEENADGDILSFQFEDGEGKVHLNSDSCQMQMKNVFSKLIKLSLESDVILAYIKMYVMSTSRHFKRNLMK